MIQERRGGKGGSIGLCGGVELHTSGVFVLEDAESSGTTASGLPFPDTTLREAWGSSTATPTDDLSMIHLLLPSATTATFLRDIITGSKPFRDGYHLHRGFCFLAELHSFQHH